jgi:ssDNA-binding Zn-finger/Zn-ribbon topoisomerase 1
MAVKEPESMDDLIYFTRRSIGNGKVMAWVYKKECPQCHKAKMGKPVGDDGSVKIRAKEYQCPECGFTEEKKAHEESLVLEAKYTCPHCGKEGEGATEYKRKTFEGVPAYVIICQHCGGKIGITKKMKEGKK